MTTDLIPLSPAASADAGLRRTPSIAADLLPPEIVQLRRTRQIRRGVLTALLLTLCLLAAWQTTVSRETAAARGRLEAAQDEVLRLQKRQNTYADLVRTKSASKLIQTQLAALLADDLQWSRLLGSVRDAAPTGVRVTGMTGSLTATVGSGQAAANGADTGRLPQASGERQVGTLTVTGTGADNRAVAAYVDALDGVHGLASPLLSNTTRDEGVLQFTVQVEITDTALGGRYTTKTETETETGSAGD